MAKVYVVREGLTEQVFLDKVLSPHLSSLGITLIPVAEPIQKYRRIRKFIWSLLRDSSATLVTTMLDYYGLPANYPGRDQPRGATPLERVKFVEANIEGDVKSSRFRAYCSLHEFEALLFSDPEAMAKVLSINPHDVRKIRDAFPTPEEINDGKISAPSKRIIKLYPRYVKTVDGVEIATTIGLNTMRSNCPHFNEWVTMLESLAGQPE